MAWPSPLKCGILGSNPYFHKYLKFGFLKLQKQSHIKRKQHPKWVFKPRSSHDDSSTSSVLGWGRGVCNIGSQLGLRKNFRKKFRNQNGLCGVGLSTHNPKYQENITLSTISQQKIANLMAISCH